MGNVDNLGKTIKNTRSKSNTAIKRVRVPEISVEKVRDVFDPEFPLQAQFDIPYNAERIFLDLNFGPKLPSLGCCGDCVCGVTESYTSDALIDGKIYLVNPYIVNSTVVYLDGIRVTLGVEYTESGSNQIWIHVPFSTITISYQYTTGNCTDTNCIDTGYCLDFAIFSGLATVFADRFDRGIVERNGGQTMGGCGVWASAINPFTPATTMFAAGQGTTFIGDLYAPFGGPAQASGKSIEVVLIADGDVEIDFITGGSELSAPSFKWINHTNPTTIRMQMLATVRYIKQSEFFITVEEHDINKILDFTVPVEFMNVPKGFRMAQYPTGDTVMRVWEYGTDESLGYEMTVGLSDWVEPDIGTDIILESRMLATSIIAARVDVNDLRFIKIGAGLDAGDWTPQGAGIAYGKTLSVCEVFPDFDGHPYFGDCDSTFTTVTPSAGTTASFQATVTFPVVIGDQPPTGSGRATGITQRMGTVYGAVGHPGGYRIKGKVRVGFAVSDLPVSVIFSDFPGSGTPGYGNNNFNGNQIGSMSLSTNADPVPFSYNLQSDGNSGRWGVHTPQLDQWAQTLDFIPGSFLFAPDHGYSIQITEYEVEAEQSVQCTAGDICGICADVRCPEIIDSFEQSYPSFLAPTSQQILRTTPQGIQQELIIDDGVSINAVGGGIAELTWVGLPADGFSGAYFLYPNSPFECRIGTDEDYFASFEFKVNTLSPASNYAEIIWGGWQDGAQALIYLQDGINGDFDFFGPMPVSFSANEWVTCEYKTEANWVYARAYPTGGTPSAWTGQEDSDINGLGSPRVFYAAIGYDQDTASNFIAQIKNVTIRRV